MISDLPIRWVNTEREVKQLAVRLEELRCQRWAEDSRYVYIAGLGVPTLNRHGKLQGLGITIPHRNMYIITARNLAPLSFFLQHSPLKKVVFDCRDLADCLLRRHNLVLDKVLDLQIIELVLRGQVACRVALPSEAVQRDGKISKVVLKDKLFTIVECSRYYLDNKMNGLDSEILVVEYFRRHFSFLVEFGEVIFSGRLTKASYLLDCNTGGTIPHDYRYFSTISHRHSMINSGKTHRDGSLHDTHDLVYGHVISKSTVLSVVECTLCHVFQPVDSYSNDELYSYSHVCKTCNLVREQIGKFEKPKKAKWICF